MDKPLKTFLGLTAGALVLGATDSWPAKAAFVAVPYAIGAASAEGAMRGARDYAATQEEQS